jgi:hypothetical protein
MAWSRRTGRRRRLLVPDLVAAALVIVVLGPGRAAGEEHVLLRWTCTADGDAVRVERGPEQIYRVLGRRDRERFTSCTSGREPVCRTMTLHRFDVDCQGKRVAWMDLVAAATRPASSQVWVAHQRLHIRRSANDRHAGSCDPMLDICWRERRAAAETVVLPPGFAPALHLAPRFGTPDQLQVAGRPSAPGSDAEEARTSPRPAAAGRNEGSILADTARSMAEEWQTAVVPSASGGRLRLLGLSLYPLLLTFVAMLCTAVIAIQLGIAPQAVTASAGLAWQKLVIQLAALRRTVRPATEPPPTTLIDPTPPPALSADWPEVEELHATAVALAAIVRQIVEGILQEGRMRDVLLAEVDTSDAILGSSELASAMSDRRAAEARQILEKAIDDLQRTRTLARIEHERTLEAGVQDHDGLPDNRSEACAFLGVNPLADDRVVKKVVDALRQNWHPDLASDDADRCRREARMKQINAAWDLIRQRSVAAA